MTIVAILAVFLGSYSDAYCSIVYEKTQEVLLNVNQFSFLISIKFVYQYPNRR